MRIISSRVTQAALLRVDDHVVKCPLTVVIDDPPCFPWWLLSSLAIGPLTPLLPSAMLLVNVTLGLVVLGDKSVPMPNQVVSLSR